MTRPIGYYVHHHGAGHRMRALAIADRFDGRMILLGTGLARRTGHHRCIDLPDDRIDTPFGGDDGSVSRPEALHYAPIDHDGIRRRVAAITTWIADERPALMIVDVSCEIAMLARLASVATAYVRLGGRRDDPPHLEAFRAATSIIAPFAEALDDPSVPDWVRKKTVYIPGLVARAPVAQTNDGSVLVVLGKGGTTGDGAIWASAARAVPDRFWTVIGPCSTVGDRPHNLAIHGWVDDPEIRIARAGIVVGSGGDGVVGAVLAARRPFICIPEDRPFAEQQSKAERLVAAGAAISCDDVAAADWSALLARAEQLDPHACAMLDDPAGVDRFARYVMSMTQKDSRT